MNNFNIDENTINKFKSMMNNGELNDVISKIPPDVMNNFSSTLSNNGNNSSNFNDFDPNMVMKIMSVLNLMNGSNSQDSNFMKMAKLMDMLNKRK